MSRLAFTKKLIDNIAYAIRTIRGEKYTEETTRQIQQLRQRFEEENPKDAYLAEGHTEEEYEELWNNSREKEIVDRITNDGPYDVPMKVADMPELIKTAGKNQTFTTNGVYDSGDVPIRKATVKVTDWITSNSLTNGRKLEIYVNSGILRCAIRQRTVPQSYDWTFKDANGYTSNGTLCAACFGECTTTTPTSGKRKITCENARLAEDYIFYGNDVTHIYLPEITKFTGLGYQFYHCYYLKKLVIPKVTVIEGKEQMTGIGTKTTDGIVIDSSSLTSYPYCGQVAVKAFVLRNNSVVPITATAAISKSWIATKTDTGFVYVPDDLVDAYKSDTNWSVYAGKIKPLSEYDEGMNDD